MSYKQLVGLVWLAVAMLAAAGGESRAQVITPRAPLAAENPERRRLERARTDAAEEKESELTTVAPMSEERLSRVDALTARIAELDARIDRLPTRGADFLTQAGVNVGQGTDEIGVQAADLYFSRDVKFFLRSTLPISGDAVRPTEEDDTGGEGGEAPSDEPAGPTLNDNIRSALTNPYGGLLYATVGYLPAIGELLNTRRLEGVFLDLRGGLKAAEIPSNAGRPAGAALEYVVSPFFTMNAGLRVQKPLFRESDLATQAGDFAFSALWIWNAALDRDGSDLFAGDAPALRPHTHALHLSVGVMLSDVAYVSLEGTPLTRGGLGKRWVVGLNLIRTRAD